MQRKFPLQTHLLVINCSLLLVLIILMLFLSCSKIVQPIPIPNNDNDLTASPAANMNFSIGANSFFSSFVYTSGNVYVLSNDAMGSILQLSFSLAPPSTSDTINCIGTIVYHTSTLSLECDNATFTVVLQDSTISGSFYGVNWMLDQTTATLQWGAGSFTNITLQ
jgi:hypothetical protein